MPKTNIPTLRAYGVGNLAADPDLRTVGDDLSLCQLRVAFDGGTRSDGQDHPTIYLPVNVWGNFGESCAEHLSKGRGIFVDGPIRQRRWQDDDQRWHEITLITADRIRFLPDGQRDSQPTSTGDTREPDMATAGVAEDIPF